MKPLTAATIVALTALGPAAQPALAQDSEITAADVVDRESLEAFVHAAVAYTDQATTLPEYLGILQEFRVEGRWKQGSIYVFVLLPDGLSGIPCQGGFGPVLGTAERPIADAVTATWALQ